MTKFDAVLKIAVHGQDLLCEVCVYIYIYISHKPEISYGWISKEQLKGAQQTGALCHPSSPDRR